MADPAGGLAAAAAAVPAAAAGGASAAAAAGTTAAAMPGAFHPGVASASASPAAMDTGSDDGGGAATGTGASTPAGTPASIPGNGLGQHAGDGDADATNDGDGSGSGAAEGGTGGGSEVAIAASVLQRKHNAPPRPPPAPKWNPPGYLHPSLQQEAIDGRTETLTRFLEKIHKQILSRDHYNLFVDPVTDEIAPGYSKIIEHPMDLSTMKSKIDAKQYNSIQDFSADFQLMCNNARVYNEPGSFVAREANKIDKWSMKMIDKERKAFDRKVKNLMSALGRKRVPNAMYTPVGAAHAGTNGSSAHAAGAYQRPSRYTAEVADVYYYQSNKRKTELVIKKQKRPRMDRPPSPFWDEVADDVLKQSQAAAAAAAAAAAERKNHLGYLTSTSDGDMVFNVVHSNHLERGHSVNIGQPFVPITTPFPPPIIVQSRLADHPAYHLRPHEKPAAALSLAEKEAIFRVYGDADGERLCKSLRMFAKRISDVPEATQYIRDTLNKLTDGVIQDIDGPETAVEALAAASSDAKPGDAEAGADKAAEPSASAAAATAAANSAVDSGLSTQELARLEAQAAVQKRLHDTIPMMLGLNEALNLRISGSNANAPLPPTQQEQDLAKMIIENLRELSHDPRVANPQASSASASTSAPTSAAPPTSASAPTSSSSSGAAPLAGSLAASSASTPLPAASSSAAALGLGSVSSFSSSSLPMSQAASAAPASSSAASAGSAPPPQSSAPVVMPADFGRMSNGLMRLVPPMPTGSTRAPVLASASSTMPSMSMTAAAAAAGSGSSAPLNAIIGGAGSVAPGVPGGPPVSQAAAAAAAAAAAVGGGVSLAQTLSGLDDEAKRQLVMQRRMALARLQELNQKLEMASTVQEKQAIMQQQQMLRHEQGRAQQNILLQFRARMQQQQQQRMQQQQQQQMGMSLLSSIGQMPASSGGPPHAPPSSSQS